MDIKRWLILLGIVLFLLAAFWCKTTVRRYPVQSELLTAPLRGLLLSDLHEDMALRSGLFSKIESLAPDFVFLTGDIVYSSSPNEETAAFLARLAAAYPCYYVPGNHEGDRGDEKAICAWLSGLGMHVLRGSGETVCLSGQTLYLYGLPDPSSRAENPAPAPKDVFSILLAHRPERIASYLPSGYSLILNGHAHGGLWRLPGLQGGLYAPSEGLFPKYAGGRIDHEASVQIISRGLVRFFCLPRIFNPPELCLIELTPPAPADR